MFAHIASTVNKGRRNREPSIITDTETKKLTAEVTRLKMELRAKGQIIDAWARFGAQWERDKAVFEGCIRDLRDELEVARLPEPIFVSIDPAEKTTLPVPPRREFSCHFVSSLESLLSTLQPANCFSATRLSIIHFQSQRTMHLLYPRSLFLTLRLPQITNQTPKRPPMTWTARWTWTKPPAWISIEALRLQVKQISQQLTIPTRNTLYVLTRIRAWTWIKCPP